ncbi:MAG TPA: low affinity iron permease family protein [Thermoanaerobaculia bacterium]|nr:low affinity iron permease family protein [Thermoanaerobaculia bacterium]
MESKPSQTQGNRLERFSQAVSQWTGSSPAFGLALGFVVVWAVTGPLFGFSQGWQMVINTGTTIATFLMVFLIQRAQNKESRAIQLKLNEIVAAIEGASNRLVGAEELSEAELHRLHDRYVKLAEEVQARHGSLKRAASVEETTGSQPAAGRSARTAR